MKTSREIMCIRSRRVRLIAVNIQIKLSRTPLRREILRKFIPSLIRERVVVSTLIRRDLFPLPIDLVLITTDLPTLLCIASGIAIFTGMICFVLKLFSRARYSRPRHYANANHGPPMLFSSDTGKQTTNQSFETL